MMNMANMQGKLVKQGWFRKPLGIAAPVVPNRTGATASVSEISLKLDLGTKVLETNNKANDDIIAELNLKTATNRTFPPIRSRGIVSKTNIQEDLLKVGWYKNTDEAAVHGPRSSGKVAEGTTNFGFQIKNYHEGKLLSETSQTKSTVADDVADKRDWIRRKEQTVLQRKPQQGIVFNKEAFRKNLLSNGWYAATGYWPLEQWNTGIIFGQHDYDTRRNRKTKVNLKQSSHHQTRVKEWVENSNKILMENERKKKKLGRKKSEIKYEDKRSKKAKPHEKAINNLLREGWTMVKRTRHQVTLAKLPEREPPTTYINETLSNNAETKVEKQTQFVPCENGDVETNITDLSNNTTSIHRFLQRSRKMLRRMFRCGRKEE